MNRCSEWGKQFLKRCRKAEMVVESAVLLPLFLFAVLTMISFMNLYRIQTEKLTELCELAKTAGIGAAVLQEEAERDLSLPFVYSWSPPFRMFPLPKVWMSTVVTVRVWSGSAASSGSGDASDGDGDRMVYVTEHGTVYHNEECSYLNLSIREVSAEDLSGLRNRSGGKYDPCEYCCHGEISSGAAAYVTDYGESYHSDLGCSGLTRTVHLMLCEEAQETMRPCSRCGG